MSNGFLAEARSLYSVGAVCNRAEMEQDGQDVQDVQDEEVFGYRCGSPECTEAGWPGQAGWPG